MKFTLKHFLWINLITLCVNSYAQQDPLYSMYMFDKVLINPAFAGSSNWVVGTLKYRNQFSGLKGNPTTQTFNLHAPIQKKHIGVGFKIINDKINVLTNLNVAAQLSYHLNFAGGKLSLGIEAGVVSKKINYQDLVVNSRNDQALTATPAAAIVPDFNFGFYYQKKQFYTGFSTYHLIKKSFNYSTPTSDSHLYKHLYFLAGNIFDLSKSWSVEPSLLLKYQPSSSLQVDLNTLLYYDQRIGVGLQYRTGSAFTTMLRINITESLRISYAYDMTVSKLNPYSKGSHELIISYGIKLPPPPTQKEIHPRYYF